jgi:hypothetical protein
LTTTTRPQYLVSLGGIAARRGCTAGASRPLVGRIHYRGNGSGVESAVPTGWMLRFRAGKVLRFQAFREPEQTLQMLGQRD